MTRTAMRDRVCIGQTWRRRRDRRPFTVRQVWRTDRLVRLISYEPDAPNPLDRATTVPFAELRRLWELVEDVEVGPL